MAVTVDGLPLIDLSYDPNIPRDIDAVANAVGVRLSVYSDTPPPHKAGRVWYAPTSKKLQVSDGAVWVLLSGRRGATVTLHDTWATVAIRTHDGTWTKVSDTDTFVGALSGNTTPIVIPAGMGGLYATALTFRTGGAAVTGRSLADVRVNGSTTYRASINMGDTTTSTGFTIPLAAGDTVGVTSLVDPAPGGPGVDATLTCYRVGP